METLYLLHYNNYYNRIVKKENSLSDYMQYLVKYKGQDADSNGNTAVIQGVNFIENDFVSTAQVVNWGGDEPDYLIVVDEEQNIKSRWFVIEVRKTRMGQLQLSLHRDLIVDHYDEVLGADCLIERATIKNPDDPAVYSSENVTVNQIKKQEILLKDETDSAWIVGFVPRDNTISGHIDARAVYNSAVDKTVSSLSSLSYYSVLDKVVSGNTRSIRYGYKTVSARVVGAMSHSPRAYVDEQVVYMDSRRNYSTGELTTYSVGSSASTEQYKIHYTDAPLKWENTYFNSLPQGTIATYGSQLFSNITDAQFKQMDNATPLFSPEEGAVSNSVYNDIINDAGKIVLASNTGIKFKIVVTVQQVEEYERNVTTGMPTLYNIMKGYINKPSFSDGLGTTRLVGDAVDSVMYVKYTYDKLTVSLVQLYDRVSADFNEEDKYNLVDAPYDMFCIPYKDGLNIKYTTDGSSPTTQTLVNNNSAAFALATRMMASFGEGSIYDLLLLPFCPVRYIIQSDNSLDATGVRRTLIYRDILDGSGNPTGQRTVSSIVLWATNSSFKVPNLGVSIPQPGTASERKLQKMTKLFRLCSPNYSGVFEFSPAMNGGVQRFVADCTYKPYESFIRVAPLFGNYYGTEFNDLRGLICGGDFSMPQMSNNWANYQLNNKNYQQMFDRQVQNMEVKNDVAREQEKWQARAGALSAGVQAAGAGAMAGSAGGPLGAAVGGISSFIAGMAVSGAAAKKDRELNEKLRQESMDFATDMFNMQMQNIQALPESLAKSSAFTIDNKIYPFLEIYECTDVEYRAIKKRLELRGYSVDRIGSISEFLVLGEKVYIKARIIRLEELGGDYHIVAAIAKELYEGVFI